MIEKFTNQYPVSKTLRFKLLPIGKTEENFSTMRLLEEDEKRAEDYIKVKGYIDRYHKKFIDSVLSNLKLTGKTSANETADDFQRYVELYFKADKTDTEKDEMKTKEKNLRVRITDAFKEDERYKILFKADMLKELLPAVLESDEEKEIVESFDKFTTYFQGFWENRKNMYASEEKATAIAFRCINENLPRFLDNAKSFQKIKSAIPSDINQLDGNIKGINGTTVCDMFCADYFSYVLSQSEIEYYNQVIGGFSEKDSTKIKGLNEYINLYNQQEAKEDKSKRLPLLKPLHKQILSDRETVSFVPEKIANDDECLQIIRSFYCGDDTFAGISETIAEIRTLFEEFSSFDLPGIYFTNGLAITDISNKLLGSWHAVKDAWKTDYEKNHPLGKKETQEKYYEKEEAAYKKTESFSVQELQSLIGDAHRVDEYFKKAVSDSFSAITKNWKVIEQLVSAPYSENKRLSANDAHVEEIKTFLDSIKELEFLLKPLKGTGKEENKDNIFYAEFLALYDNLTAVDTVYNRIRNYLTQKPYSDEKIKLNFQNPQFLGGWDKNKETDYRCVLLRKEDRYYLAIMDKSNKRVFEQFPPFSAGEFYEKMEYKLLPGPNKMLPKVFFAKSNLDYYQPNAEIIDIYKQGSFKKSATFDVRDCRKLIDYFKTSIEIHPDWKDFRFQFSKTETYQDISAFYKEVADQGYNIKMQKVPAAYVDEMVASGALYLFQIYNKDFSSHSHGKPNLHTMYFKMLFDEENLKNVVYKLNGQAEMFYRKPSITEEEIITHKANMPIQNKNRNNSKKESLFEYDIIKDKRYTERQFMLHIPITMNFKSSDMNMIDLAVRHEIQNTDDFHVIGIDRGERNLVYITVIDKNGKIITQRSLNIIKDEKEYSVDYHTLLSDKESDRDKARKNWKTIGNIKELKEGYLSQVVHQLCELIVKYDAFVAMEDLNSGFMNSRKKIEKQVYQKFEKMLTDKLNYLVLKENAVNTPGGLLKAYQLTKKDNSTSKGRQNGIIFYIPAWLTSKIDPTTGFVSLIKAKYTSIEKAREFFGLMDDIRYVPEEDLFAFDLNYGKFPRCDADHKKKWTVYTNGERIETFRNPENNNAFDCKTIALTPTFKALFADYRINIDTHLKEQILEQDSKEFFLRLMKLFNLTLQMRNSMPNDVNVDYLISPVKNASGGFYDSRKADISLPHDADANGAYNIARKGLWALRQIQNADDPNKANISISNKDWLAFAQSNE